MTVFVNGAAQTARPFDDAYEITKKVSPFWTIENLDDLEQVEEWCEKAVEYCEAYYAQYFQLQLDNLLVYRGIQWLYQEKYANANYSNIALQARKSPRIVLNHVADSVEYWVSKLVRYKPAVAINPANSEPEDADAAKATKDVLSFIWDLNRIDQKNAELVRLAKITGEAFMKIDFDPNIGDIHPDFVEAARLGERVPVLDSEGNPVLSKENGTPIYIQDTVRVGEVTHKVIPGWHILEEPRSRRENINWCFEWEAVHVDELKAQYPDQADKIKADGGFDVFKNYGVDVGKGKDDCIVYHFYHRHCPYLEKGRYVKRIKGLVLESKELPFSHGQLPYIYLPDIEIPGQSRGMSFIQQVFPVQHQINACASLIYKCLVLLAHPKYAVQEGQCEISQLVNEATIVQYTDQPPQLMQMNIVPSELFQWLDKLEQIFNKLSGQFTLSTGQAPSGVRAAKALRLIEEQEDKRAYAAATRYNNIAVVDNAKMTVSVAGDYYDDSDGRLARVLGKNNEYRITNFKKANLSKPYDIRVENSTALSQSPAARIEELIELSQVRLDPNAPVSREQFIKLLDLNALEEFKDVATRAYSTAKYKSQMMREGQQVSMPLPTDDLIVHWRVMSQEVQGVDYHDKLPPQVKELFNSYIFTLEYLMWKKAFGITDPLTMMPLTIPNPVFQQQIMTECKQWPLVFQIPAPGMLPQPMPGPMGGAGMPGASPVSPTLPEAPLSPGEPLQNGAPVGPPPMGLTPSPLM